MTTKKGPRERIDVLLVAKGLADSREQAKRLILAKQVEIVGMNGIKPGQLVDPGVELRLKEKPRYVSRGGLKLERALLEFGLSVTGKVCIDIGSSTGGFTDCMLQAGAKRVFSVDVGNTQLHERVKHDSRVTVMDNTNARNLMPESFDEKPVFAAVDVSFISVLKVTDSLLQTLEPGRSDAVLLIKPQFEAGKKVVSQGKGVIKDAAVHREILRSTLEGLAASGWSVNGLIPSPIAGGSGNIEFLCWTTNRHDQVIPWNERIDIDVVVQSAGATVN